MATCLHQMDISIHFPQLNQHFISQARGPLFPSNIMKMIDMGPTAWYAITLGAMVLFFALFSLLPHVFRSFEPIVRVFVLKHLLYPRLRNPVYARRDFLDTSRFETILRACFLASNIATLTINYQNGRDLFSRAGLLSTINLIPLAFGAYMNPLLNYFGVRLRTLSRTHHYLAWLVLGEALLHVILAATLHFKPSNPHARVAAIVVCRYIHGRSLLSTNLSPGRERNYHNGCVVHLYRPSSFLRSFRKTALSFNILSSWRSMDTLVPW